MIPNTNYKNLKDSYLFYHIAQKTKAYLEQHPGAYLYRMGIGDVSLPLCDAVIQALHKAVDDQAVKASFHGYMPECGDPELRRTIAGYYKKRNADLSPEEVFISSGASDELGYPRSVRQGQEGYDHGASLSGLCGCQYHRRQYDHTYPIGRGRGLCAAAR